MSIGEHVAPRRATTRKSFGVRPKEKAGHQNDRPFFLFMTKKEA
jgi:hypothetical protein